MIATVISLQKLRFLFGAKTGKGRVRGHMMWLPHHPRFGKGVERGHMMCLLHLSWIITFNDTVEITYTEENATKSGKIVRER